MREGRDAKVDAVMSDKPLKVTDVVVLGGKHTSARWVIHDVHPPTQPGEKFLVSLRPEGKPPEKDCEGWPAYRYHTIEASKVRRVR